MRHRLGVLVALTLPLLGASCISFGSNRADGGLFVTVNRGGEWVQRGTIPSASGTPASIANANIAVIAQDPQDRGALYVGTDGQGGFYSWDGGGSWWPLGTPFARSRVDGIAVDPKAKCTIYVAAGTKAYKSTDCTRSWRSSDFENTITAIAIDPAAPSTLYAGNSRGDILKSVDGGGTWRAVERFENRIRAILMVPAGGRGGATVIVGTHGAGFRRSVNGGEDWEDLRKGMEQYPAAFEYKAAVLAPDHPGTILSASKYGILVSSDFGTTWNPLTLLTAPGRVDIYSMAVNPKESDELVYATATTFYKSSDGGKSWDSKKLPTSRAASVLMVDAADGNTIWMGTRKLEQ